MHIWRVIRKLFRPLPKITRCAYSSIIRPALTYGCHVWSRAINDKSIVSSLARVNILALLLMGNFRTRTLTAGLEVISYIPPLHLFTECEASMKFRRIQGHLRLMDSALKTTTLRKRGHRFICWGFLSKLGVVEVQTDEIPTTMVWNRHFSVIKDSFTKGKTMKTVDLNFFTESGGRAREGARGELGRGGLLIGLGPRGLFKALDWGAAAAAAAAAGGLPLTISMPTSTFRYTFWGDPHACRPKA